MNQALNLIVPIDFTVQSKNSLQLTRCLSRYHELRVHLIHWVKPLPKLLKLSNKTELHEYDYALNLVDDRKQKIKKLARKFSRPNINFIKNIKVGSFIPGLKEATANINPDLIVMGTSGKHSFSEKLKGNKVERVVRNIPKPVLSVRKFHKNLQISNILLVVDMSDQFQGIANVVKLSKIFGSTIHLLMVNPSNLDQKKEAVLHMKLITLQHGIEDYTLNYVAGEEEFRSIKSIAKIKKANLIAVFTENQHLITDLFNKDTAKQLINKAARPVLTVK